MHEYTDENVSRFKYRFRHAVYKRKYRKESLCNYHFSMLYFVCENARDLEQAIMIPLNEFT